MSRVAPNLSYLTIYNPTLRPSGNVPADDEDAEEQAHILFYTSKERAVSRDRMLRQIGLAKALINFSDMFNAEEPCNNVHSQTRRMIMVSPEPNFWIHAGVEVAKTPRPSVDKGKGKGKEKSKAEVPVVYDYHEYSVHNSALQTDIMRGYEKFKLRHGSFSSILAALGQEALELQLERFFTVWAWSWNLEDGPEFGEHLGPPLHPLYNSLAKSLDDFSSRLPTEVVAIALSPPYIIPSTRYTEMSYPVSLPNFLLSFLPPSQQPFSPTPPPAANDSTLRAQKAPPPDSRQQRDVAKREDDSKMFLGMNFDSVKMDMPKWNWPGYLTFGKGGKRYPELLAVTPMNENKGGPAIIPDTPAVEQTAEFEVDRNALEDAMLSERIPSPPEKDGDTEEDGRSMADTIMPRAEDDVGDDDLSVSANDEASKESEPTSPEPEPADFSSTTVHLASTEDPQATRRRKLFYLIRDRVLVAILGPDGWIDSLDPDPSLAAEAATLAVRLQESMDDEALQSTVETLPSAAKILQPKDRFAMSSWQQFTVSSADFESRSAHLYNARQMLRGSEPDISEVFSRGQNPQHWHVGRRGLGTEQGTAADEEVYMEVFRKEASLTDVDNALANVIRKSRLTN